ncbi:MAG: hypothetical protein IT436_17905 [Phycisphaerales bacterium]|nr:hypothetical protein [Phycisphaerales bacterium]
MLTAAICAIVLLSALATAVLAIVVPPKPAWTFVTFELVIAVCCALALPFGRGAYRDGPGLALICFAGAIFAGSVLGYLSVHGVLGTTSLKLWVLVRVALAGVIGAAAVGIVLIRNPRSWGVLAKGLALLSPLLVIAAVVGARKLGVPAITRAADKLIGLTAPLTQPGQGLGEAIRLGAIIILGVIAGGLFCAGLHFIIRAFEICREPEAQQSAAQPA